MSRRGSLFASASVVSATILIGTNAYACNANFYPCEPQGAAAISSSPLSDLLVSLFKPGAASASAPAPLAMTAPEAAPPVHRVARRKSARHRSAASGADTRRAELAATPPLAPADALPSQALAWAPIGLISTSLWPVGPIPAGGREEQGAIASVRIVSAEEINEIDLAAPTERVTLAAVRPERPDPSETTGSAEILSAAPAPRTADTSLLERVLVTFGGAFGAASAMRIFIG